MEPASHRVLLVDDSPDSSEPLSLLLQSRGHETRIAIDGETALAAADEFAPHCVLLDLGLPRMDGYEVARRLRARPNGAELILVALTGWTGKDVRTRAADAGFDYHLVKPVNWEELEKIVESAGSQAV
jgi:CheY-like chemotaxis protein